MPPAKRNEVTLSFSRCHKSEHRNGHGVPPPLRILPRPFLPTVLRRTLVCTGKFIRRPLTLLERDAQSLLERIDERREQRFIFKINMVRNRSHMMLVVTVGQYDRTVLQDCRLRPPLGAAGELITVEQHVCAVPTVKAKERPAPGGTAVTQ